MPRATRKHRPISRRSGRDSRSSGGRRATSPRSTLAGRHPPTRRRCNDSRRNSSRYSPTSFFRTSHPPRPRCCNKRAPSPVVYPYRFFTELGGLLSYGVDVTDNFRRAAIYADRILKGEKPSDLPVQAPVKFELVINLKTA